MRSRILLTAIALSSSVVLGGPSSSAAQSSGGRMIPVGMELSKVLVGSWADYQVTQENGTVMKSRWALVARDKDTNTIEMISEGGPAAAAGGKIVTQLVLESDPTSSPDPIKSVLVKAGPNPPVKVPTSMPNIQSQKFKKPDPKAMVGREEIGLGAKKLKVERYRETSPNGNVVDIWISKEVPPFGVVRLETRPPVQKGESAPAPLKMKMELVSYGKDAKPSITDPSKAVDIPPLAK